MGWIAARCRQASPFAQAFTLVWIGLRFNSDPDEERFHQTANVDFGSMAARNARRTHFRDPAGFFVRHGDGYQLADGGVGKSRTQFFRRPWNTLTIKARRNGLRTF
jgi:hypothetical protein